MRRKWYKILFPAALMTLLLSGCLFQSPQDLYRQPEKSAGYEKLNAVIQEVCTALEMEFDASAETAVILAGDNTATIQLQDLDGDGTRESAITFLRIPSIEKSIKIFIFTQIGEEYRVSAVVEGDGSAIYSIDYVDLNGSGYKELVVNWQISTGVYQLGVYTLDELMLPVSGGTEAAEAGPTVWGAAPAERAELLATELLLTRCSAATEGSSFSSGYRLLDIDRDTRSEVAVVRIDSAGVGSHVEVYGWRDGAMVSLGSVPLSAGIVSLTRIRANYLGGEFYPPALYVTSTLSDGRRVIDVLSYQNGRLTNLTMDPLTGVSREVMLGYTEVDPTDINGDYVIELPSPSRLPVYGDNAATNFWLIDWYQYQETGERDHVMTTYHNVTDSWYLVIPQEWEGKITISRNDQVIGQREVIFSLWQGEDKEPVPFLSIYRLTGLNRAARSTREGRFVLREEENVIYSAAFYDSDWDCGLDETSLLEYFRTIQADWYSQ